jgi:Putative transposase/Transposase zinc-binding domain
MHVETCAAHPPRVYRQRDPAQTVLHEVVREHLEEFLSSCRDELGSEEGLPKYVEQEFRSYLSCGSLSEGFIRLRCDLCHKDRLLPFSCKGATLCASCAAHRMESTAAHLVDRVLPEAPLRLWTLSLPFDLRRLLAADSALLSAVHRCFIGVVFSWMRARAREAGISAPRCGAISFIQRHSASLGLDVHFHTLAIDGVYAREGERALTFHETPAPAHHDIASIVTKLVARVRALFRRRGLVTQEGEIVSTSDREPSSFERLVQAAARDKFMSGRLDSPRHLHPSKPSLSWNQLFAAPLSEVLGFNLHANTRVSASDKEGRARLCRYATRPPFAESQFTRTDDGRIAFALRKPRKNGDTHLIFTPLQLLRRLAWLVPPPRRCAIRYEGILAPGSKLRKLVVPAPPTHPHPSDPPRDPGTTLPAGSPLRLVWAALLKRVYLADALACPTPGCHGRLRPVAAITQPDVIKKILDHLGLCAEPPSRSRARAPPGSGASCG